MERQRGIGFLILLFFKCALINGIDLIADEGSTVTLRCPKNGYGIWKRYSFNDYNFINGTTIAIYYDIVQYLPNAKRLRGVLNKITWKFDLQIMNVSSFDEGVYICRERGPEQRNLFSLYIKRLPSNLRFVSHEHTKDISTIEGQDQTLVCVVQSGMPRESLTIIKNGSEVMSGCLGKLTYSFVANRSDHMSEIECMANSSILIEPLSTRVRLLVKYVPRVTIIEGSKMAVTEGRELMLSCHIDCHPDVKNISWSLSTNNGESVLRWDKRTLLVTKINRNLSGDYICRAENDIGKGQAKINVAVQYPPDVRVFGVMDSPTSLRLDCVPKGEPAIYTFHPWEQKSIFDEHIRFLHGMKNGTLIIDSQNKSESYENDGIYVCTVSNGVENELGAQNQHIFYFSLSSPVFFNENAEVHFTTKGSPSSLTFYIYSATPIRGIYLQKGIVSSIDSFRFDHGNVKINVKNKPIWHIVHGKLIRIPGFIVNVDTMQVTDEDYGQYTVETSNSHGTSYLKFEIKPATVPENPTNITIYPALQTVTVTWIKRFNGGYQQKFYIEIRKPTEQRWDRHGPFEETFGKNLSAIVYGLESGSVYLLRMFSNNKLGDSNKTDTITVKTRQKKTPFLSYIVIGVAVIVLLFLTNGCARYKFTRKQHRKKPQDSPVNAEPVGVQYGPYDEIGFPADGYFEIVDPVSINARTSLPDFGGDISQPRNAYLDVTNSTSTLARNSVHEPASISSANECRNDDPQEQSLSSDSSCDYAELPNEDGACLNSYNSLQGEPQGRCHNYTDIKRSSTTSVKEVYSKGSP